MNRAKRVFCVASLLLPPLAGLACGGATPEPAAAKPAETKPVVTPPDVSAVPAPSTLVVLGRVAKPGDIVKIAGSWSGVPLPPDMVAEIVASAPVGAASDLTRPLDFAVATDPRGRSPAPGLATSLAIRPLDEARPILEKSFTLKPLAGGVYRLEEKEHSDDDDDDRRYCGLYPSADVPFRLVCATSAPILDVLGPYLARTAPREKYPSDVHVELTLEPFRDLLSQARTMLPTLLSGVLGIKKDEDPAAFELASAALGDVTDFAIDLNRIQFDAKVADAGADGTFSASFKGTQSLTARLAVSHPERADAPPAAFWRMPGSSDVAYFHRGIDEKELTNARDLTLDAIVKQLGKAGLSEADKSAVKGAISHSVSLAASPAVFAKGLDFDAEQKAFQALSAVVNNGAKDAKDAKDAKSDAAKSDAARAVVTQLAGWSIVSIEEPVAKVSSVTKEIASVLARPAITKWFKAEHHGGPAPTLKETPSKLSSTLPKGTTHFELTVVHGALEGAPSAGAKGASAAKKTNAPVALKLDKPIKLHLFLAPDGARTLAGYGVDEALVAKMLGGVAASTGTLEQREALGDFKRAKLNAGGFFDARALVGGTSVGYVAGRHTRPEDPFRAFGATPAHGLAPIPFAFVSQPSKDGSAGTFVATATVSKAAVQDIVAGVMHSGR